MHQLSITSDIDSIVNSMELPQNIKTEIKKNAVTFSSDEKLEIEFFKESLKQVIVSIIKTKYQDIIMKQIISSNHNYLNEAERKKIFSKARGCAPANYDEIILPKLEEFLSDADTISIEGFVNFRLRDYKDELEKAVESSVQKFLIEREYNEFIGLLKYFVENQPSKAEQLHVVVTKNGGYSIYDEALREITHQCAKEIADIYSGDEISFDDILISSLISIAPQKITFHKSKFIKTRQLLETIEKVFENRIVFCDNCPLCSKS